MRHPIAIAAMCVVASFLVWLVLNQLGLSDFAGNALTIFTAALFYILAATSQRPDAGSAPGPVVQPGGLGARGALTLLTTLCLGSFLLLLVTFHVVRSMVDSLEAAKAMELTDGGYVNLQISIAGWLFILWMCPQLVVGSAWIYQLSGGYRYVAALGATALSFLVAILLHFFIDPDGKAQTNLVLDTAIGSSNPFVPENVMTWVVLVLAGLGFCLGMSLLLWLPAKALDAVLRRLPPRAPWTT